MVVEASQPDYGTARVEFKASLQENDLNVFDPSLAFGWYDGETKKITIQNLVAELNGSQQDAQREIALAITMTLDVPFDNLTGSPLTEAGIQILARIRASRPQVLVTVYFETGSIFILGAVLFLIHNPVVQKIGEAAALAILSEFVKFGVNQGLEEFLKKFGIKISKPVPITTNNTYIIDSIIVTSEPAAVTSQPAAAPELRSALKALQNSLNGFRIVMLAEVLLTLIVLIALLLEIFNVIPNR